MNFDQHQCILFFQRGVDLVQLSLLGGDLSLQLVLLGVSQRHDISGEGHGKGQGGGQHSGNDPFETTGNSHWLFCSSVFSFSKS